MHTRPKVAIIGAGNVGAIAGYCLAKANIADIVFVDVVPGMPQSKAFDLGNTVDYHSFRNSITGSNDYQAVENADVVIHTAGLPRKPGMDRMDLLKTNVEIAQTAGAAIKKYAPHAIVIVVANPLDVIAMAMYRETGFPSKRVFGMAGTLDATRFRYFVAERLQLWPPDVNSLVLGGHGDTMVPLPQYTAVAGIPLLQLMGRAEIQSLADRTRSGGGEIVGYLKVGGAYYAPGASSAVIAQSILSGIKRIESVSVLLQGEYGIKDMFLGVPACIGPTGIEQVIELPLDDETQAALNHSAEQVAIGVKTLDSL